MSTSTPGGSPDHGDATGPVSDEQWAELVRRAEEGGADAPKEPSARARTVTARLRALDEEAARGRGRGRKGRPAEQWQPEGWRTGPAWREMNGRARKRRRVAGVLGMALVLGALVVAMRPSLLTDHLPGGGHAVDVAPLPAETAPPTAAPPVGGARTGRLVRSRSAARPRSAGRTVRRGSRSPRPRRSVDWTKARSPRPCA